MRSSNQVALWGRPLVGHSSARATSAKAMRPTTPVSRTRTTYRTCREGCGDPNTPADQTVKNVPSVFAPGLAAAGLETCLGSVSGGGAFVGTGFSFGTTIPDPGCAARLDARTLWSMGLKKAAVARLCLNPDIYRAMPEVCGQYLPQPAPVGYPAPVPVPTRYAQAEAPVEASEEQSYTGGDIWLVEGATGKNRLCNDYDVTQQRCRVWAHTVHHSSPKKTTPAPAAAETEKKEESQVKRIERVDLRHEHLLPSLSLQPPLFFSSSSSFPWSLCGKNRLCNDYDVTQQRCRGWAHTVHHSTEEEGDGEW